MNERINVYRDASQIDLDKPVTLLGWFNPNGAEVFKEPRPWNGENHVGLISGLQAGSERLYLTAGGRWVRHYDARGQYNGPEFYEFITPSMAREWLLRCGDQDEAVVRLFGEIEEESGPEADLLVSYKDIEESLQLILGVTTDPQKILSSLRDAVSNNLGD